MKENSFKKKEKGRWKWKKVLFFLLLILLAAYLGVRIYAKAEPDSKPGFQIEPVRDLAPGTAIDEFNGVTIYFNGKISDTHGRNLSPDGYNIGQKYQCVEFIKRYYLERLNHKMPNVWGHAKDYFNGELGDGAFNADRGLVQYKNGSAWKPEAEDLLVIGPSAWNSYGHVAIIAEVGEDSVLIVQQNAGPPSTSREKLPFVMKDGKYFIYKNNVLGWLRLP